MIVRDTFFAEGKNGGAGGIRSAMGRLSFLESSIRRIGRGRGRLEARGDLSIGR